MRSVKQIEASRINGAKSRGPVTAIGRFNSAHPNWRQSLLAKSVVTNTESRARFQELHSSLLEELQPSTAVESLLVQKMAVSQWRQMRLWGLETQSMQVDETVDNHVGAAESRYDRQFNRALSMLLSLRETGKRTREPAK